jgi:YegS C-terminal NAD kinase beta sandwich-like domain
VTIAKGQPWGEALPPPSDLVVFDDDAAAGGFVFDRRSAGEPVPPFGLRSGDLARTVGGGTIGRFDGLVLCAPVDLLRVTADGATRWAVAHVVARGAWWRGEVLLAMNAQFVGVHDVAPRSHPNDGKVDVLRVEPSMTVRARWQARGRSRTGTHLPHPLLTMTSAEQVTVQFGRPLTLWLDGRKWRPASSVTISVEPDALTVFA